MKRELREAFGAELQAAREAARLLTQCGVQLARAELHVLEASRAFHFYSTPVSRELLRRISASKPAVFFVEDTRNRPAYDAEAIGRTNAATRPELADTAWVAYGVRDLPQGLAHELVHVLSDSGEHSEEPQNLMRTQTSPRHTRLSAQCRSLASGLGPGRGGGFSSRRANQPQDDAAVPPASRCAASAAQRRELPLQRPERLHAGAHPA